MTPLLSIIIPVYNAGPALSRMLDCVVSSALPDAEVLIVDDGSTDGSVAAAMPAYASYPRIRALRQENAGPAAARNLGICEASGKYLAFLDADDTLDPAAFRKTVSLLEQTGADLLASDFHRVDGNGAVLDRVYQIPDSELPLVGREHLDTFLQGRECVWNVWRYLFKKSFLLENGLLFDETAKIAEDLEFVVRALGRAERPAFFHNPYYRYVVSYGNTLTRRYTAERVGEFCRMIVKAKGELGTCCASYASAMSNKLAREYIYNLAVCVELPAAERKAALDIYRGSWHVLDGCTLSLAGMAKAAASLLGLRPTADALLAAKRAKRALRGMKHPKG